MWTPDDLLRLTPEEFERVVADLWRAMGYAVRLTAGPGDAGVDVVATMDTGVPATMFIQAKCYSPPNKVGVREIREYSSLLRKPDVDTVVVVCSSGFTDQAIVEAREQKVRTIDGPQLVMLLNQYNVPVPWQNEVATFRKTLGLTDREARLLVAANYRSFTDVAVSRAEVIALLLGCDEARARQIINLAASQITSPERPTQPGEPEPSTHEAGHLGEVRSSEGKDSPPMAEQVTGGYDGTAAVAPPPAQRPNTPTLGPPRFTWLTWFSDIVSGASMGVLLGLPVFFIGRTSITAAIVLTIAVGIISVYSATRASKLDDWGGTRVWLLFGTNPNYFMKVTFIVLLVLALVGAWISVLSR